MTETEMLKAMDQVEVLAEKLSVYLLIYLSKLLQKIEEQNALKPSRCLTKSIQCILDY